MKNVLSLLVLFLSAAAPLALRAQQKPGIIVKVDAQTGGYTVFSPALNWTLGGTIGQPVKAVKQTAGQDAIGAFTAISFEWTSNNDYTGSIRWYKQSPVVIFSISTPKGANGQSLAGFPDFTKLPDSAYRFSYHNRIFPLAQFYFEETSSPWMLFNDRKDACLISPASDFMVSLMSKAADSNRIISGLNPEVKKLPANFTHSTILVMDNGIRKTWDSWGGALRKLYHRNYPDSDSDTLLKYFGFWTDVGGDYYYSYDTSKGYEGTLLALKDHYKKEGIPLGYIQLDSWWYQKSSYNVHNEKGADKKKPELPGGGWNRSGGLMEYTGDPFLFPDGLDGFQKKLGLPLITHNRWVDSASPYHNKYKISGIGAIDPGFWEEIMAYLKKSGVSNYEQDWINYIYMNNPEMISDITVGNAFTDGMAKAAKKYGINMQYCMGLPRYFMQGVKYNNLTSIRTAGDRFKQERWGNFLFTSQLAFQMGIYPWSDVFKSDELGNMIVSVLSAGVVGTGDSIGTENKANILKACRADGVLVKPDVPLLPLDQNYIQMARNELTPVVSFTHTQHNKIRTGYVFAFAEENAKTKQFSFRLQDIGIAGKAIVYNPQTQQAQLLKANGTFSSDVAAGDFVYYIVAPFTAAGISFLGDEGKIAATGKKRIAAITESAEKLQAKVLFAKGESSVTLRGYSENTLSADKGKLLQDASTHLFTWIVPAPKEGDSATVSLHAKGK